MAFRPPEEIRFAPPPWRPSAAERWLLVRAFGPPGAPVPHAPAAELAEAAEALGLTARIAARVPPGELAAAVGAGGAARWRAARSAAAASALGLQALLAEVAAAAGEAGIPVAPLKGVALLAAELPPAGGRPAADLDVLVPSAAAEELGRRLVERGFTAAGSGYEHQLAPLAHPTLGVVEVHRHLPGLRPPGRRAPGGGRFATWDDLATGEGGGLLEPSGGGGRHAPRPALLVAHALAHGIAQHGWSPAAYPALRTVADLCDLGLGGPAGASLLAAAGEWTATAVRPGEAAAARALCRCLLAGELPAAGEPAERLLAHFVLGARDARYRRSLTARSLTSPLSERSRPLALAALAGRTLWPTRSQLDQLYGPAETPAGRVARRLRRPVDLLVRLVRAVVPRRAKIGRR